jgi:hypothetical protein
VKTSTYWTLNKVVVLILTAGFVVLLIQVRYDHRMVVHDDSGCAPGNGRVNSVAQFVGGWIFAGFPARVIPPISVEPRPAASLAAII